MHRSRVQHQDDDRDSEKNSRASVHRRILPSGPTKQLGRSDERRCDGNAVAASCAASELF